MGERVISNSSDTLCQRHPGKTPDLSQPVLVHTQDGPMQAHPGESLLETLERHGHQLEFQCRSGYCGACRTGLLAGKVHYPSMPLAFVSQGECLPCCCRPVGSIYLDLRKTATASPA